MRTGRCHEAASRFLPTMQCIRRTKFGFTVLGPWTFRGNEEGASGTLDCLAYGLEFGVGSTCLRLCATDDFNDKL